MVKNLLANAGDAGDRGLNCCVRKTLEEEMASHSSILAWKIPWTEEPGRLQSMGLKSHTQVINEHEHIITFKLK